MHNLRVLNVPHKAAAAVDEADVAQSNLPLIIGWTRVPSPLSGCLVEAQGVASARLQPAHVLINAYRTGIARSGALVVTGINPEKIPTCWTCRGEWTIDAIVEQARISVGSTGRKNLGCLITNPRVCTLPAGWLDIQKHAWRRVGGRLEPTIGNEIRVRLRTRQSEREGKNTDDSHHSQDFRDNLRFHDDLLSGSKVMAVLVVEGSNSPQSCSSSE